MVDSNELIALGLVKKCCHINVSQMSGQIYRDYCGTPTLAYGGMCSKHSPDTDMVKQARTAVQKTALVQRQRILEEVLPKATERMLKILDDDESKDADVIRIWMTSLDRVGLGTVSGLVVEGEIKVEAPLDILRAMLRGQSPDVIEGEIVEED